ncbi:MAG TPA: helix-turn-helix domain-containing protein [Chthoniobacteraceae bacterium]|nr:helix-turn-helix domain-containing protein [Chthoniobacteraceae bacterium]
MKPPSAQHLRTIETAAPALNRGLALWMLLQEESPLTLEEMTARLSLPKASARRLLESLCRLGLIRRLADKRYEPLWALHSLRAPADRLREALAPRMAALCRESRHTVEWYEPTEEGLVLVLQELPDTEVHVKARPGFLRTWGDELEATITLGHALIPGAPLPKTMERHQENGVRRPLSPGAVASLLDEARQWKTATDNAFNTNGVRRAAVAMMEGERLLGVLALAEVFRFGVATTPQQWLEPLTHTLP